MQVHWFSILNSLMVVVVMSCIVAMIMMRTIRKDLAQYEALIVEQGARLRHLQLSQVCALVRRRVMCGGGRKNGASRPSRQQKCPVTV